MPKRLSLLILVICLLQFLALPSFAQTKSAKILRTLGKAGEYFLQSGNGMYMNGSFGIIPKNNYPGYDNSNNIFSYLQSQPNLQNVQPLDPYSNSNLTNYYPISSNTYQAGISNFQKFNVQPQQQITRPTGQIYLKNAKKEDVLVLLNELCSSKNWSIREANNNYYYNTEIDQQVPGSYDILFTNAGIYGNSGQRHLLITINQESSGTLITAYSSAYLVKDQLGKVIAFLNKHYSIQATQFE